MPLHGEYEPSPWDFVADQVRQYEETGGREGYLELLSPFVGDETCSDWTRSRRAAASGAGGRPGYDGRAFGVGPYRPARE